MHPIEQLRSRSRSEAPAIIVISSDAAGPESHGRAGALLTREKEQAMLDAGAVNGVIGVDSLTAPTDLASSTMAVAPELLVRLT